MSIRALLAAGAAATLTFALAVPAADASSGPPPPVSSNGHKVQLVASGLQTPTSFAFGAGHVFVGDAGSESANPPDGGVYVLKNGTAVKVPSKFKFVAGLAWHAHKLYVSGGVLTPKGPSWRLAAWGGWNGTTFTKHRTLYIAPKGFDGFNGIGFGANGRLYVGVDVGLTDGNDHGARSKSPFLYDILSFKANGKDRQVFARGMRQPWQFAFAKGSNSPYVTDLGQDGGATNPPDFVLHVKAGQDYGFPKCNRTKAKPCKGYAKPFRKFGSHTDLMGIATLGKKLYVSSFTGRNGQGQGGAVYWFPIAGGKLKPLLTGFVAPTVGLGLHNGYVYVGELTGQVYRVKV